MNLKELEDWLAERNLGGHWNRRAEQGAIQPFLWKWSEIYQGLMWANELVPMEKTGRRTITLKNPGLKAGMTHTIHMSVQCVLPGEIATAHRHNFSAIRFILKGSPKAFTVVEGERLPMQEGDFMTTPNWTWHDHYNGSDEPVYWLDGLDVRLTGIGARLYEEYPREQQPVERPKNYSQRLFGHVRPTWIKIDHPTPPFLYRWDETFATLEALKDSAGDPYDAIRLQYAHPVDRGPTLPTFSCEVLLLRPGEKTQTHRHNSNTIYQVFRGAGLTQVEKQGLAWDLGDIFVVPAWHWHNHENRSAADSILFSMTDAPTFAALGLYREEPLKE
jgi:1-hydroxy-2-naphthoate dioxygenase